jgi:hypothetical protein
MEISGVSNASTTVTRTSADNAASVLVARKALDNQRQQGEASVKLIDEAGVNGKGRHVNTYA